MSPDLVQLARKLAEGARSKVDEEERRIDGIIAARKAAEAQQQSHPTR
ncbi:MAG TPA: hypothetical protein VFL96_16000 [Acidobacteriaceae bacterium]|nr:hypothetical protein [Acidobacteriaceae bacterium]